MTGKPKGYEVVPFRMSVPAAPKPAPEVLQGGRFPDKIPILGLDGQPTRLQEAQRRAEELLRRCRYRHERGNRTAVIDLVRGHPELVFMDAWLRQTLLNATLLRKKPGRPRSSFYRHPLVIVGLVSHLRETGEAATVEEALHRLDELGFGFYDSLKSAYYQAHSESRFQAVLKEYPARRQLLAAEEAKRLLSRVRRLGPGEEITYTGSDPRLGELTVRFKDAG